MKYFVISWEAVNTIRSMLIENIDDCMAVEPREIISELANSLRSPTELTHDELHEGWTER